MFNKNNFCHVASNNRNEKKAGIFVYKTTDDLATVTTSGYFNDKIVDINLHDLIIHEWHDPADRTKVEKNVLCVTERTLDNVGTAVIKSKWEGDIEQDIADLQTYVDQTFVRKDGASIMTGPLKFRAGSFEGAIAGGLGDGVGIYKMKADGSIDSEVASLTKTNGFVPGTNNAMDVGRNNLKWKDAYIARVITATLNNGVDLTVPTPAQADTIALKSEVDLAANSGDQLTNKGVWYAKMYAATVAPSAEDGTNYADFSQVDTGNNPIIVLYERQNGAWVETDIIAPPADYNGYVTVTSKIWDIVEQAGQQGGLVLWSHNTKTFTPYPRIISTDGIAITNSTFTNGTLTNVTTEMPVNPVNGTIVNKQYVDNAIANSGTGRNVGDTFLTMRTDNALNGAVECDGSFYNTTDFTGAQSIGELLENGKVPYVSMATYAADITAKGWCDKFGWDGTGNIQFRVPTLNAYIWQKTTAGIKGSIGQSNVGEFGKYFVAQPDTFAQYTQPAQGGYGIVVTTNQTIPGASVDTTDTMSDLRVMVQLAISATDEAVETCTNVTADVAALKTHDVIEFQAPTAANNYTWYRKYRDGWVEQGGTQKFTAAQSVYATVNLPVEMANSDYTLVSQPGYTIRTETNAGQHVASRNGLKTTTTIFIAAYGAGSSDLTDYIDWQVSGMAAQ